MNGNIIILLICVSVFYVIVVDGKILREIKPEIETLNDGLNTVESLLKSHIHNGARQVDSTVYKSVNKYSCSFNIEGSHLMVYGSKGWTFPVQDVNLTLQYPPENKESFTEDEKEYIITGFKVILFIDGPRSEGFINDGGVLQESISLSFISSQLTSLSYEFWLYGARKDTPGVVELSSHYRLC